MKLRFKFSFCLQISNNSSTFFENLFFPLLYCFYAFLKISWVYLLGSTFEFSFLFH